MVTTGKLCCTVLAAGVLSNQRRKRECLKVQQRFRLRRNGQDRDKSRIPVRLDGHSTRQERRDSIQKPQQQDCKVQ